MNNPEKLLLYTPDDLRKNTVLRKELADKSKEVMDKIAKMENIYGAPPAITDQHDTDESTQRAA